MISSYFFLNKIWPQGSVDSNIIKKVKYFYVTINAYVLMNAGTMTWIAYPLADKIKDCLLKTGCEKIICVFSIPDIAVYTHTPIHRCRIFPNSQTNILKTIIIFYN